MSDADPAPEIALQVTPAQADLIAAALHRLETAEPQKVLRAPSRWRRGRKGRRMLSI